MLEQSLWLIQSHLPAIYVETRVDAPHIVGMYFIERRPFFVPFQGETVGKGMSTPLLAGAFGPVLVLERGATAKGHVEVVQTGDAPYSTQNGSSW